MGETIGAEVWLDRAPLKYAGLSYTEIWISEAQERMVLAVPEANWPELEQLCAQRRRRSDGDRPVRADGPAGAEVQRRDGRRPADAVPARRPAAGGAEGGVRAAAVARLIPAPSPCGEGTGRTDLTDVLRRILGSLNVASKEWVIRQYDHEVQGGSVVKPLVGVANDGPSDAAVVRPVLDSRRGVVIACGMNPRYGDFDTYHMAASAIDEAVRNCVAVGADPARIAILDNFCWGDCERPETLGSLVRAALACHDVSLVLGTPFISGKDSLNNEFSYCRRRRTRSTRSRFRRRC